MTLREYIQSRHLKIVEAARELGMTAAHLCNISHGTPCSLKFAEHISAWTGGKVAATDLMRKTDAIEKCPTCGKVRR